MNAKYLIYRAAFEFLYFSQIAAIVRSTSRARGLILTLHRVVPEPPADFSPNAILQVTPQFLEAAILRFRKLGYDTVSMDEAVSRTCSPEPQNKFVVFSFDDAYIDNFTHALPILEKHKCPFTLYVPTAFVDGVGVLWWQLLEDVLADQSVIALPDANGHIQYFDVKSEAEKETVFADIYARLRQMDNSKRAKFVRELAQQYGIDAEQHCQSLIMNWPALTQVAKNPLCTIGAHTVNHFELSKLDPAQLRNEIEQGAEIIADQLGERPQHFSYPYGGASAAGQREYDLVSALGFASAVTTKPGGIYYRHKDSMTSLPRISLNGNFQQLRYLDVYAAPAIFSAFDEILG